MWVSPAWDPKTLLQPQEGSVFENDIITFRTKMYGVKNLKNSLDAALDKDP